MTRNNLPLEFTKKILFRFSARRVAYAEFNATNILLRLLKKIKIIFSFAFLSFGRAIAK